MVGGVWFPHTNLRPRLTLHQDFAQGAGVACGTGCKAHVLAGVNTRQVVQDKGARAVRIFYEDVVRVHLYRLPIWKGGRAVTEGPHRDRRRGLAGGSQFQVVMEGRGLKPKSQEKLPTGSPDAKLTWRPGHLPRLPCAVQPLESVF